MPVFRKLLEGPPAFMSASIEHVGFITIVFMGPRNANSTTESAQLRFGNLSSPTNDVEL